MCINTLRIMRLLAEQITDNLLSYASEIRTQVTRLRSGAKPQISIGYYLVQCLLS